MARTNPQQFIHMNLTGTQLALITQITFPAVVGAVAYLYRHLVANIPDAKREKLETIVNRAVRAAEQAKVSKGKD